MLPLDLIFLRHGESEFNIASKRYKKGDQSDFEGPFKDRHNSKWRLSDRGREQAKLTGKWFKKEEKRIHSDDLLNINRFFVSPMIRAKETAALLDLSKAEWKVAPHLRERDYGNVVTLDDFHPYYGSPDNGESLLKVTERVRHLLNTLARECSNQQVLVVCHGEFMWAARLVLEKMSEETFINLHNSDEPFDHIWNCQVLHYSRRNSTENKYNRMRSICPWDLSRSSNEWVEIENKKYSNQELLEEVEKYPVLVPK